MRTCTAACRACAGRIYAPEMSPLGCTVLSGRRARPATRAAGIVRASRSVGSRGPAEAGNTRSTAAALRAHSAAATRAARLRQARLELLDLRSEGDNLGPRTVDPAGTAAFLLEATTSSAESIETPSGWCSSAHPPAQTPAAADPEVSEDLSATVGARPLTEASEHGPATTPPTVDSGGPSDSTTPGAAESPAMLAGLY